MLRQNDYLGSSIFSYVRRLRVLFVVPLFRLVPVKGYCTSRSIYDSFCMSAPSIIMFAIYDSFCMLAPSIIMFAIYDSFCMSAPSTIMFAIYDSFCMSAPSIIMFAIYDSSQVVLFSDNLLQTDTTKIKKLVYLVLGEKMIVTTCK